MCLHIKYIRNTLNIVPALFFILHLLFSTAQFFYALAA